MNQKLNIEVKRVFFPPVAQGGEFFVLLTSQGKASGKMKWRPEPGERLTLDGEWGAYRGEKNFNFKNASPNVPVNPKDQLHYACDRAVGIGPVLEQLIWNARGTEWRDTDPGEVKGFSPVKHAALMESIATMDMEAEKSQAIGWLMGKGASINMAVTAYEELKKDTIGIVQANCFRLADMPNFSFVNVDGEIREAFEIGLNDPRRIRAAILYKLKMLTGGGSTVIQWPTLRGAVCELVGAKLVQMVSDECGAMFEDGSLVGFSGTQSISLMEDYRAETGIWKFVNEN